MDPLKALILAQWILGDSYAETLDQLVEHLEQLRADGAYWLEPVKAANGMVEACAWHWSQSEVLAYLIHGTQCAGDRAEEPICQLPNYLVATMERRVFALASLDDVTAEFGIPADVARARFASIWHRLSLLRE